MECPKIDLLKNHFLFFNPLKMAKQLVTPTMVQHTIQTAENGKVYRKTSIKCEEVVDTVGDPRYISGFTTEEMFSWRPGVEMEIEFVENGEYLNLKSKSKEEQKLEEENKDLKARLSKYEGEVEAPKEELADEPVSEKKELDKPAPEDLPF
jgi:hypothetical protein